MGEIMGECSRRAAGAMHGTPAAPSSRRLRPSVAEIP